MFLFLFQWFQIQFLYYRNCRLSLSADVAVLCIYFEVIHQYLHTHTENICGCKNLTPLKKQRGELCNAHRNAEANRSLSSQCEHAGLKKHPVFFRAVTHIRPQGYEVTVEANSASRAEL